jgi:transposase IS4-like protein/DDE family transposase
MARTVATFPADVRLADYISLGVLTASFPVETVHAVLARTGRASERERELPAHVMVYYAIALALYADVSTREVLRCLLDGVRWLGETAVEAEPTGKTGISKARTRLGAAPLEALYREVVAPVAADGTPGAWYRGWRVMSLDGSTLDVSDTAPNARAFGRPSSPRGVNATGAFPQLRVVGLLETGTHVLCGAQLGPCRTSEVRLAAAVVPHLTGEMLCLADRGLLGFDLWQAAAATGAALLWRAGVTFTLPILERFADGSYRSELRWNSSCTSADRTPIPVRVIEYTLPGVPTAGITYRLVTNVVEPKRAPAEELAALYQERWEMETAFDEFKTHLRGAQRVFRSKTPELVRQEAWGFLLAHFAIRALMHEAALGALPRARDPDTMSFTHALRVTRRTLPHVAAIPPSGPRAATSRPSEDSERAPRRRGQLQSRPRRASRRQAKDE